VRSAKGTAVAVDLDQNDREPQARSRAGVVAGEPGSDDAFRRRARGKLSQLLPETQVVKFHGDFNRPETMVLSERDYERRMRLEDAMDLKLRSDVLGRASADNCEA
jgi:SIR2-like domain